MRYAFYCAAGSNKYVFENGGNKGHKGSYSSTSTLAVYLEADGKVKYAMDGAVFYTSTMTNNQWPLYVGASVYSQYSPVFTNIQYSGSSTAPPNLYFPAFQLLFASTMLCLCLRLAGSRKRSSPQSIVSPISSTWPVSGTMARTRSACIGTA